MKKKVEKIVYAFSFTEIKGSKPNQMINNFKKHQITFYMSRQCLTSTKFKEKKKEKYSLFSSEIIILQFFVFILGLGEWWVYQLNQTPTKSDECDQ